MKYINYPLITAFLIVILSQVGCLSTNEMDTAENLVEMKDYRGAIEAYQGVVEAKPGTAKAREAQLAIGEIYLERMDQPAQGIMSYETIIADAPESDEAAEAHYRLGMHYYQQKEYDKAQTQFDTIVNQYAHLEISHNAQLMLAKSYEEEQDFERAVEVFDNFANRNPQSTRAAQALANKARIQRQFLKNETEAKRTLQSMVKRYGKHEGAESHIEKAKEELTALNAEIPKPDDPKQTQFGRALARQEARRERDRPTNVEKSPIVKKNIAIANSGFGVSADEVMRDFGGSVQIAGDEQGSFYDAELMIAGFLYGDENYLHAGALLFDAIARAEAEKAKLEPIYYLRLSICYRKVGMHKRAMEVLKKAATRDSKVIDTVRDTGKNQYTNEEYEKALETFQSIIGINRNKDPEIYWLIGKTYNKLGDYQKERDSFEQSVALNPEDVDTLQSLAEVLNYRLRDRKTAGIFQDLADQKRDSFITMKTLGDVCDKYGQHNKAQIKYKAAARNAKRLLDKAESPAEKRLLTHQYGHGTILAGLSIYKQGREEDAQKQIDIFLNEYPDHALVPYANAEIALLKDEEDQAINLFKEAIDKDPVSDIPVIALGDLYVSKGYNDEAILLWEGYLEKNKYNSDVRRRLQPLKGTEEKSDENTEEK